MIGELIAEAVDYVENEGEIILVPAIGTVTLGNWCESFMMDKRPVSEIVSIKYYDEAGAEQNAATDIYINGRVGDLHTLRLKPSFDRPNLSSDLPEPITITVSMGHAEAFPKRVRTAVRFYVNEMYNHRDNPARSKVMVSALDRLLNNIRNVWVG